MDRTTEGNSSFWHTCSGPCFSIFAYVNGSVGASEDKPAVSIGGAVGDKGRGEFACLPVQAIRRHAPGRWRDKDMEIAIRGPMSPAVREVIHRRPAFTDISIQRDHSDVFSEEELAVGQTHRCREIPSSRQRASQLQRNDSLGRQGDGRRQEVGERQDNEGGEMFHISAEQKAEGKVIARREGLFPSTGELCPL